MEKQFDIPVCIFLFKRSSTLPRIFDVLRKIKVKKIYLRSDEGRNEDEKALVKNVRDVALSLIDWECEVVKDFATSNRGVYQQIGIGAIEILAKEKKCIFLEDDNLPNESFFYYCKQMLSDYENDEKTLMICGTNYGGNKFAKYKTDCFRVKALLPCGWASWEHKFAKNYSLYLEDVDCPSFRESFMDLYKNKVLAKQQYKSIFSERQKFLKDKTFYSWDFHLIKSIMVNDLYVISPKVNLIKNIGIDEYSAHNKISLKKYKKDIMARRFCEVPLYEMDLPLSTKIYPKENTEYQRYCDYIICKPFRQRVKEFLARCKNAFFKKH